MDAVTWIKLDVGMFDNKKIKQIAAMPKGDTTIVIWIRLLILAADSECGELCIAEGLPYDVRTLAKEINKPAKVVQQALDTFLKFGMIEDVDGTLYIKNWGKYQNIAGMERVREKNRLRNIAYRERKKGVTNDVTMTSHDATEEERRIRERERENIRDKDVVIKEADDGSDVLSYAKKHISFSGGNEDELKEFQSLLPAEVIRFAIDEACANEVRKWAYVRSILVTYNALNIRTVEQAKAHRDNKASRNARETRRPMDERPVTESDFVFDPLELMNRPRSSESA